MNKFFKTLLIIAVIFFGLAAALIAFFKYNAITNTPITLEQFKEAAIAQGFEVKPTGRKSFQGVQEEWYASKMSERNNPIYITFYVFDGKETTRFAFQDVVKQLKPYATNTYSFSNNSDFFGNTQYYIELSRPKNNMNTSMITVDNTMIMSRSKEWPVIEDTKLYKAIGYDYGLK